MSEQRRKKLKSRDRQKARRLERNRDLLARVLSILGLTETFQRLPTPLREPFYQIHDPKPQVEIGVGSTDGLSESLLTRAREAIEERINVYSDSKTTPISFSEFEAWFFPFAGIIEVVAEACTRQTFRYREATTDLLLASYRINEFRRLGLRLVRPLLAVPLSTVLSEASSIDRIYWFDTVREETKGHSYITRIRLHAFDPERRVITVEGKSRPAFRFAPEVTCGPRYLVWDRSQLGLEGEGELAVYLQKHVMDRIKERLCVKNNSFVNMLLTLSLREPEIIVNSEDDILVEVRLGLDKVGYLVGKVMGKLVLIQTFLFLTNQGTPESERLRAELRLRRPDIDFMMLDTLRAFTNSDMATDETLIRVFEKCGCGHLFSIVNLDDQTEFLPGQAKAVRDHLQLVEKGQSVLIRGREAELPRHDIPDGVTRFNAWKDQLLSDVFDDLRQEENAYQAVLAHLT